MLLPQEGASLPYLCQKPFHESVLTNSMDKQTIAALKQVQHLCLSVFIHLDIIGCNIHMGSIHQDGVIAANYNLCLEHA